MAKYPGQRIRCEVDVFDRTWRFQDVLTGEPPIMWRGGKGQFELGFFYGHGTDKTLVDFKTIGGLGAITLAMRGPYDGTASGRLSTIEFSKTLLKAALTAAMTIDEWNSNAADKAHAIIPFTDDEVSLDTVGDDTKFWMTVSGMSDDDTPEEVPLAASVITLLEDGVQDGNSPRQKLVITRADDGKKFLLQSVFENAQAANELFADTEVIGGGPYRTVIVKNATDNTWHEVKCTVVNGVNTVYADPAAIAGIATYPKNYVRNITDWDFYELTLQTQAEALELALAEVPLC